MDEVDEELRYLALALIPRIARAWRGDEGRWLRNIAYGPVVSEPPTGAVGARGTGDPTSSIATASPHQLNGRARKQITDAMRNLRRARTALLKTLACLQAPLEDHRSEVTPSYGEWSPEDISPAELHRLRAAARRRRQRGEGWGAA